VTRVSVDCETTGLAHGTPGDPAREDGVVELGLAWQDKQGMIHAMKYECNPGEAFIGTERAEMAYKVNGYTEKLVRTFHPVEQVAREVRAVLIRIAEDTKEPVTLAAYNAPFDSWFLAQPPWGLGPEQIAWEPDLMVRAAKAAGVPAGTNGHRFKLDSAMKFAQIERYGQAHDAESDAVDALKLAAWLDERDRDVAFGTTDSVEDVGAVIRARLAMAKTPEFPKTQPAGKIGNVSPSDLWMCPRAYWGRYHGEPREVDLFFNEIKGPLGNACEKIELDRFEDAGFRVLRAEYVGDELFTGKLDARIEWPPGSDRWIIVEVKSVWTGKTLQASLAYPSNAWMDQIETYMRVTGIDTAILRVFKVGTPDDPSSWDSDHRVFHPDDTRWKKILAMGALFRLLQATNAIEPACDCGRCGKAKRGGYHG